MVVGPRVMKFGVCDPQVGSNNPCKAQIDTTKFRFLRPILLPRLPKPDFITHI